MPRIEAMKQRLENWALWHARSVGGGLGYPRQTPFARLAAPGPLAEAVIPVDEIEASRTDVAMKALQFTKPHLHRTATVIYLEGMSIKHASFALGKGESTVKSHLEQLDHALQQWLLDQDEQRRLVAERARGSFTT